VSLLFKWSRVLPGWSDLCHFSSHDDVRVSGLVPVPAVRACVQGRRGFANLDHSRQWDSNWAAALALLGLILQLRGGNPHLIWHGDPLLGVLGGIAVMMFFAAIIGFLTTSFYVIALKLFYRRSTVTHRGVTRT